MRVGEKVVVRIKDNSGFAFLLNGLTGTIVEEKISNSQLGMLSGVSRWIIKFDKPANVLGTQLTTCEFRESELECLTMYEIVAYDKDTDVEISLHKTTDYSDARAHALKFGEQCRLDLLLNPENGQPFDWVKLVNADDWNVVYWTSYDR